MAFIEESFDTLQQAIETNNSDRIPNTIVKIKSLLVEYFLENNVYGFALIINNFIKNIKLIHERECYEKLGMFFDLNYTGRLNLIDIIKKEYYEMLPAIIFNQCDLAKQAQMNSVDPEKITAFKIAVYGYLKDHFDVDVKTFFTNFNVATIFDEYLKRELLGDSIFDAVMGFTAKQYLSDMLLYKVEYMLLISDIPILADDITGVLKKLHVNTFLDILELFHDDFDGLPLLFQSEFIGDCFRHNGFSASRVEHFRSTFHGYMLEHHYAMMDDKKVKLKELLLFSSQDCFDAVLSEMRAEINIINPERDTMIHFSKSLPQINRLINEVVAHCILSMCTNDAEQFSKYISSFVDVWLESPIYIQLILFNLFSCKYQGKSNYQEIVHLDAKQLKQILCWYVINSSYMDLLNMSRNSAISFRQYKNFKLNVYNILCINYEVLSSSIHAYLLLQDSYELQDVNNYALLINILLEKLNSLLQENKKIEVINMLQLTNGEETLDFFLAAGDEDKNRFHQMLIDLTCEHMKSSCINITHLTFRHTSNLWQKAEVKTDYSLDIEIFRQKIYQNIGCTAEKLTKTQVLYCSFLSKEELASAYSDYFVQYKNVYLKLQTTDFQEITRIRSIRRQLLDYAEFINDSNKCAEIVRLDANMLQYAYQNNTEVMAYYLLGVDYKDIKFLDYVFHNLPQDNFSALHLIRLTLLQCLDFAYNRFYDDQERIKSAFNFKREVFKLLGLGEYNPQIEAFKDYLFDENDMFQSKYWLDVKNRIKIIQGYVLYCEDGNNHKVIWKNFINDIIKYLNNPQIQQKMCTSKLVHKNLVAASLWLYFHKQYSIELKNIVHHIEIPSHRTITKDHLFPENINSIRQSLFGDEYLANAKEIICILLNRFVTVFNDENSSIDLLNALLLKKQIQHVLDNMLLWFNPEVLADVTVKLPDFIVKLMPKIMQSYFIDRLTWTTNLTDKQKHLLAINVLRRIYKAHEHYLQYNLTRFAQQKIYDFLLTAYQQIEQYFGALDSSEQLFHSLDILPIDLHDKVHEIVTEGIVILEKAYLAQDVSAFATIINNAANFLIKFCTNNQIESILRCLKIANSEDLYVVCRYLETRHLQALKRWLINYYVDNYKVSYNSTVVYGTLQQKREEFKKQCYQQLGIELADAIDPRVEKISEKDVDVIFESIKSLANKRDVKIETYEEIIEYLSKKYDVTTKPKLLPTESDSVTYHALYNTMHAIRLCYVSGHVFSILLDKIKINNFHLVWEGAYGRVMLDYLNNHYLAALKEYKHENNVFINSIWQELPQDLVTAILSSEEKDVSRWLDAKLFNDKIISVNITLYDGMTSGHAVGAVFWKNIAVFADRGVSILDDFSGISIYKIDNLGSRKQVINALIATRDKPISSKDYKLLKDQLALKHIHQIAMSPQVRGNCTFASSAEPIHLGIVFISVLREILQTKSLTDSCMIAEEISMAIHSKLMLKVYYETVRNLYKFFKERPDIDFPLELFAHIDLLNTYKIKSKDIESLAICIPWEAKLAAYQYYQNMFTTSIRDAVNGEFSRYNNLLTVSEPQFHHYGVFLSKSFLEDNEDSEEFRQAVLRVRRSALFGDIKISPMLFRDEFDLILSSPILPAQAPVRVEDEDNKVDADDKLKCICWYKT